jgi:hypothetical protein
MSTDYETLVKEYVALQDQRNSIDERLDTLKAELRKLEPGTHEIAGIKVSIVPNRRIDPKLVAAKYPIAAHPLLYKAAPDVAALRKHLSPIAVDDLMTEVGLPKVSVSVS